MSMRVTNAARTLLAACALSLAMPLVHANAPAEKPAAMRVVGSVPLANAGFESTRPGKLGAPEGWWVVQHAGPESYRFSVDDTTKHAGERSMRVENVGPEPYGMVFQAIDATPYRGRTVRFAAWIRTEATTGNRFGTGAGLHLQTLRRGYPRDAAAMRKNAVKGTTDWTRYELVLAVANDADQIEVGLNLFGGGVAWLDEATLDVVEPAKRTAPAPAPPAAAPAAPAPTASAPGA
jgi:hypothetical protein